MPYELPANPTTLLDIRKMVVSYSGDNSLVKTVLADEWVDNGVDHYINMGMKFLERNHYTPLGNSRDYYRIWPGVVYHSIPRVKVVKNVWFLDEDGVRSRLARKDLIWMREYYPEPFGDTDQDTPTVYSVDVGSFNRTDLWSGTELAPENTVLYPANTPGWSFVAPWTPSLLYPKGFEEAANAGLVPLNLYLDHTGAFTLSIHFLAPLVGDHHLYGWQMTPFVETIFSEIIPASAISFTFPFYVSTNKTLQVVRIQPEGAVPVPSGRIHSVSIMNSDDMLRGSTDEFGLTPFAPTMTSGSTSDLNLLIMPPPSINGTIEVYGDFFSAVLSLATDENWWTKNAPQILTYAALYQREVSRRQTDAANEWLKAMLIELQSLRMDANENFGPEPGELRMEIV